MKTKPHVNVGTIGHVNHGKATLTAAILAVQLRRSPLREVSLPALDMLDSNSKPEQTIAQVVSPDDLKSPEEKISSFKKGIEQMALKATVPRTIPSWSRPWSPSSRQLKNM